MFFSRVQLLRMSEDELIWRVSAVLKVDLRLPRERKSDTSSEKDVATVRLSV